MSSNSAAAFATGDKLTISTANSAVISLKANTNILTFMLETPTVSNVTSAAAFSNSSSINILAANAFNISANTNVLVLASNTTQITILETSRTTLASSNNGSHQISNNNILTLEVNRPISTLDRSGQVEVKQVWIG